MYFDAVHTYLTSNGFESLLESAALSANSPVKLNEINKIDVILAKHGEYYHPSCVVVDRKEHRISLALNVALVSKGRQILSKEYRTFQHLNTVYPWSFLPQVYACGDVMMANREKVSMFLGQWFDDFHEFHWTRNPGSGNQTLVLWDPDMGSRPLTIDQAAVIYEQAAKILTAYFNLMTFEQIFAWHHAAGDFIVNVDRGEPQVKLITVRQYSPLFDQVEPDLETIVQGLQVFLFNLSLRMRLDRLDGVGEMTWAPNLTVMASVRGFFSGLALQLAAHDLPPEMAHYVNTYLRSLSISGLTDGLGAVAATYDPATPGLDLIKNHLKSHAAVLRDALRESSAGEAIVESTI
jgi:hypothetical protein